MARAQAHTPSWADEAAGRRAGERGQLGLVGQAWPSHRARLGQASVQASQAKQAPGGRARQGRAGQGRGPAVGLAGLAGKNARQTWQAGSRRRLPPSQPASQPGQPSQPAGQPASPSQPEAGGLAQPGLALGPGAPAYHFAQPFPYPPPPANARPAKSRPPAKKQGEPGPYTRPSWLAQPVTPRATSSIANHRHHRHLPSPSPPPPPVVAISDTASSHPSIHPANAA
ncbi:uncharacterized protein PSFLO_02167 [Pseudozyma flocculosa]|uniref:Uncharacterized protein n=1 Tax=Pseudozyma flocculosa TaxID=84751 RepID=A0A5C3EYH0_9BASI|nr:uncharacterized protein PSFLO_02167 [Pseudozyma flocculosa]